MAKTIRKPVEIKIVISDAGTEVSAHYGLTCEYGDLPRKGSPIDVTAMETIVDQIKAEALSQINQMEGIE